MRESHLLHSLADALVAIHLQLVMKVDVRSREEHVNAWARGIPHRTPGALDIVMRGAGQSRDNRPTNLLSDRLHGIEVTLGCDREARLDHVHAQSIELPRHA